jgi:FAD/FMN-containing dehydrogenase
MNTSLLADDLRSAVSRNSLILPNDDRYELSRRVWNGMADKRPAAIVRVESVEDIRRSITIASLHQSLVAVRGGGHSLPGFSTCENGVVIDLSNLNDVVVDPLSATVEVSGGTLLGSLDRAGKVHGLVVPAGVVSHTGAAGLTLGGGMGWLSRRFGLTIDHLLKVELVTAEGETIEASAESEPELFWGVRGGGGNFGIATKFHFKMRELGTVTTGTWEYDLSKSRKALRQLADHARSAPPDLTTAFNLTHAGLSVSAFHSGAAGQGMTLVAPFGHLEGAGAGTCGLTDFVGFQSRSDHHARWGRRYYAKGGYLAALSHDVIECMAAAVQTSPSQDSEIYVLQLGGAIGHIGDNATAYTGRTAQYYWIVQPIWDDPKFDSDCLTWGRNIAAQLTTLSMDGNYINEQADVGGDLAAKAYGLEKFDRLQRLKARFDPGNLFRLNQNIPPKS